MATVDEYPTLALRPPMAAVAARRRLPDPAHVTHVTVDQHLDLARQLDQLELFSNNLFSEAATLRDSLANTQRELLACKDDRERLAAAKSKVDAMHERLSAELAQVRDELAQANMSNARQQRELLELGDAQGEMQAHLQRQATTADDLSVAYRKLQHKNTVLKRQLQALRGLACAECRLRSKDISAVQTFFEEI